MEDLAANEFERVLKVNHQSVTQARLELFNLLKNKEPQSLSDILKKANKRFDRTSLYRNIELFSILGIVERINAGWKYKIELSDKFLRHHHHLNCTKCHKIFDISEDPIFENYINKLSQSNNFKISRHQLEIDGICHSCQTDT